MMPVANLGGIRDVNQTYNAINNQSLPNTTGDPNYKDGEHFIFNRKAKRLNPAEYTFNPQVGYISLNQRLNDNQLLAASFSYTVSGDSKVYKVGEFSRRKSSGDYQIIETERFRKNHFTDVEFNV